MRNTQNVMIVLASLILLLCCGSAVAETSGTCGDDLIWVLDDNGLLTISGTGAMTDYSWSGAPWYNSRKSIQTFAIEEGVTSIGYYAFGYCSNLENVTIPVSVTSIGHDAFYGCDNLWSVMIPESVISIGDGAFDGCSSNLVIYGKSGSYAETYADKNGIKFEIYAAPAASGFASVGGEWVYYQDGDVDTQLNSVINGTVNGENAWWKVTNGKADLEFTGLASNSAGWWYIEKGKVNFNFTGFADNEYGRWRIEDGKVNFDFNDIVYESSQWRYYYNGMFQSSYTGVTDCGNANGWWYVANGTVDFKFTGLASNSNGTWFVRSGKVDFGYTGKLNYQGASYTITNGRQVS